ncbi:VPS9 domain protein [Sporothrix schenckii 1099-18]|uniref:VPS9 domain protein n=1 Tax=Sporothrix schenckii 1099-18 TaxID=1397361 RepID=A0A0F2M5K4_SPOSC|nr:VPS9 domain protein [Sporothrix schenckii 1099-18]KJR84075.1 VPS9 domain protein [Sporothrix schenckii 1099-18]
MPYPLNPFLAAFFNSSLPTQCNPTSNHILLVPTTEVLLTCRDAEFGNAAVAELPNLDEFLASHVIRMPNPRVAAAAANASGGKDGGVNLREMRGKAKPYGTFNGRSVVIKDNLVYSNKGFKSLNHATLIGDTIWYADTLEPKPWLIYYISRPLLGNWEPVTTTPAILPRIIPSNTTVNALAATAAGEASPRGPIQTQQQQSKIGSASGTSDDSGPSTPRKKDIKSFHDLLNHFPVIARQMQPGLDKIYREFTSAFEQTLPLPPTANHTPDSELDGSIQATMKKARLNSVADPPRPPAKIQDQPVERSRGLLEGSAAAAESNRVESANSGGSNGSHVVLNVSVATNGTDGQNGSNMSTYSGSQVSEEFYPDDDEHAMRTSLETAVTTAIDIFQGVDKQQLSHLGATTDLTGPLVERLIERYISENLHHIIFPHLSALKRQEDLELEAKIRQMDSIDLSQLGMDIDGGPRKKHEVTLALGRVVEEFRKIATAACPQDMLSILLATVKSVSQLTSSPPKGDGSDTDKDATGDDSNQANAEKPLIMINADTLVSLLLYIIIRAQQRHLLARFIYMRHFIFIDDVDGGEMGYALSTFEAVLTYLISDSSGLRRASRRNKSLWEATAKGDLDAIKAIMEPSPEDAVEARDVDSDNGEEDSSSRRVSSGEWQSSLTSFGFSNSSAPSSSRSSRTSRRSSLVLSESEAYSRGSGLGHVFPFQADRGDNGTVDFSLHFPIKRTKRVALDTRSMSSSSEISYRSRATSFGSNMDGSIAGDISVERLSKTHDSLGESLLMMAVQNERIETLKYYLSLRAYFPVSFVLGDVNHEETTLLSAAVQLGNKDLIMTVINVLADSDEVTPDQMAAYFSLQDIWGRSVAHYLFHAPFLIESYGSMMPWRQRDKKGQTPLFALCRSYDHEAYYEMVSEGIRVTTATQSDSGRLHVSEHVDARGNTLLHIVNHTQLAARILQLCDVDVNAVNDKMFTPLMVASKYGRLPMVQTLFRDPRVDIGAKELRGLTAVELAKDDEVRNKIDDLTLLSMPSGPDIRTTSVVRSYFVEDASVRFVVKSGHAVSPVSYAVTTCRRSQTDFEHLTRLLALENPASWIPSVAGLRSPFQIPSKPSRAMLKDLQLRMDWFLRMMIMHPTFAQHEMLWEFILVPDIQPDMMAQRSRLKAETRAEKVRDELEPLTDIREVEQFVDHARELVRGVNHSTKSVMRRANAVSIASSGMCIFDLNPSGQLSD